MRSFMISNPHQISLKSSNQGEGDRQGIWHTGGADNANRIVVGTFDTRRLLGRSMVWTTRYINWSPRQKIGGCGLVSSGSG
jgi:hypothetical protein